VNANTFTPVYRQITDLIRNQIHEGDFQPGTPIDSERVLAKRFNVARMTVVRAVRDLITDGILFRQPGRRGTFVRMNMPRAKVLSTGTKQKTTVGLCFLDVYRSSHPFFSKLIQAAGDLCEKNSMKFAIYSVRAGDIFYQRDEAIMQAIRDGDLRGLLLAGRMDIADMCGLRNMGIPYIWINHEIPGENIPTVLVDYADGAFGMVNYLAHLGHKRIALLLGTTHNRASYESLVGYRLGLRGAGIALDESLTKQGYFDEESGYRMARELLDLPQRPTALYAVDDLIACGAMKAVHELGLRVPEDISVVGCGNLVSEYAVSPGLTTLDIHLTKLTGVAFNLLTQSGAGQNNTDYRVTLCPELLVRGSAGPAGTREAT
jgi:DNA-binding LacI/PurR family transcriptional regulator